MRISDWSSDVCSSDLWRVMAVLARFEGLSAREVAERTAMDKGAVSRALARLVAAGRVEDREGVGEGTRGSVRVDPGGRRIHIKKNKILIYTNDKHVVPPSHIHLFGDFISNQNQ